MYLPVYILWLFSALNGLAQLKALCGKAGVSKALKINREMFLRLSLS